MGKMDRRISVVICAYTEKRWDQLVTAVDSVVRQTLPPFEIVVVIDHNPDLLARARSAFASAVVVPNDEERGLSGARNTGVAECGGEIVAFLDDDAVAAPDWLEQLAAGYDDPLVLGTGGSISPDWHPERPSWFPEEFDWVVGCTYRGMPEKPSPVRNLIGANMSFRREVLVEVGGFQSGMGRVGTIPAGCEETELCIRSLQMWPDGVLLYEPAARVRHWVASERARRDYFASRCYAEGMSKALVSKSVGSRDGLSTEAAYTLNVLPTGFLRGLTDVVRGDLSGLGRAIAIAMGLAITTLGYLAGRASGWFRPLFNLGQVPARTRS